MSSFEGTWVVEGASISGTCPLVVDEQEIVITENMGQISISWPCGDVHSATESSGQITGTVSHNGNPACSGEDDCKNLNYTITTPNSGEIACSLSDSGSLGEIGSWTAQGGG